MTWDIEAEASLVIFSTGRMDKYQFYDTCNIGYKNKLMTKEITYDNYKDISDDAPVILDGICEDLLLAKKNIELFGGEAFIVFDTDESVGAALLIMDAGASGADTLKVMLNYLDVNMAEANAQVNELAMGKSQLIKGSLGLLKRMKKQLDAVHVTSELMLDMDEDETEEEAYDDTYEESAAGLHCMNCGAEIAPGSFRSLDPNSARNAEPKWKQNRRCSAHSVEMKLCPVQNSAQSAEQDACNRYKNRS